MKAEVDRKQLKQALTRIKPAVNKRTVLPALRGVHVETMGGDTVRLTVTNLDLTFTALVDATVHDDGQALVSHDKLQRATKKGDDTVVVSGTDDDGLALQIGPTAFTIGGFNLEDWPQAPHVTETELHRIPDDVLDLLLDKLPTHASVDPNRPVSTAVSFDGETAAATDSYRLGVVSAPFGFEAQVPADLFRHVAKMKPFALTASEDGRFFTLLVNDDGGALRYVCTAQQIDGKFPDWRQLVPKEHACSLVADAGTLAGSVERIEAGFGGSDFVPLTVDMKASTLSMVQDGMTVSEPFTAAAYGKLFDTILLNPRYLRDALDAVTGNTVRIELREELKPAMFKAADGDDRWLGLLMPVRR